VHILRFSFSHEVLYRYIHLLDVIFVALIFSLIYYINKGVLEEAKKSHHVRREGQEIPTLKKRRICTVEFYEDLMVYINLKSPSQILEEAKKSHHVCRESIEIPTLI